MLNRYTVKSRIEGSNPSVSAIFQNTCRMLNVFFERRVFDHISAHIYLCARRLKRTLHHSGALNHHHSAVRMSSSETWHGTHAF